MKIQSAIAALILGGMLASHGLPAATAYLVYIGEIVAPVQPYVSSIEESLAQ